MKYWLDTEFIDNGLGPLELISIGIVAEDGRENYAINRDCPLDRADDWLRRHVLSGSVGWLAARSMSLTVILSLAKDRIT